MSRELDLLSREYQSKKATVLRKELNLYQTSINTAASGFLRDIENQAKKQKQAKVLIIAIISEYEVSIIN
jgi:hypothetical protein